MEFWYDIITTKTMSIDFEFIYNFIWENSYNFNPDIPKYDIYIEFIDNLEFYIQTLVTSDFIEEYNVIISDVIQNEWEQWFNEKFKNNIE